jgi:hypothetical protein
MPSFITKIKKEGLKFLAEENNVSGPSNGMEEAV